MRTRALRSSSRTNGSRSAETARGLDHAAAENQHRAFGVRHLRRGRHAMLTATSAPAATKAISVLTYTRTHARRHRQIRVRITYVAMTAPTSRVSNGINRDHRILVAMAA